ncbi:hypothetical protein [Maritimibacter fusiformis]|uniref:Outer membrane protein beta-barrel domain-containing protein n=1 Tax=Maritimibacter fusiformis TaxID=2603819 RepID=A0A5D0RKH3_9RHOB|nr:hypothetical protein [Maritimibacter fusiformis]TYB81416.1 hypothetical protein FVF75_09930 [Maritimibacter fusiformis]
MHLRAVILALVVLAGMIPPEGAGAQTRYTSSSTGLYWEWGSFRDGCNGDCALTVFGGRHTSVRMTSAFGIADFTNGDFGFVPMVPVWDWPWEDTGLVGGAYSRRLASFGYEPWGDLFDIEAELGIAQRFGDQDETEVWGALYFRWKAFPWNSLLYTTVGVSTGLSYASGVSDWEKGTSGTNEGSRLLHYLSPEITFALPDRRDRELVFRFHHRSGGGDFFASDIFNHADGGSNYATVGLRFRF